MSDSNLSSKERILKIFDEFVASYERAWSNAYREDRLKSFLWDTAQLRRKIEQELPDETSLRPGELEQLRRIDRTARAYVDAPPGPEAGKAYDALQEALFDGCPSAVGSARTSATSGVTSD